MDFSAFFQRAGKVAADNSPAILTAIGVTGTLTTAYLAAKAGFKSAEVLRDEELKRDSEAKTNDEIEPLTSKEVFELTGPVFVPTAISAIMTVSAIICANRIGDRRAAAMASAYTVVEKSFKEYRDKNTERLGKKKEKELRAEIAQDNVTNNPVEKSVYIVTGKGETLCKDKWSGRYFNSDMETLRKAVNDFNQDRINSGYLSLSEFYHLIGLPPTQESEEVGWNGDCPLEVDFDGTLHPDGTPAMVFEFRNLPSPNFSRFH